MTDQILLHSTPLSELREIISEVVAEQLQKNSSATTIPQQVEFLTRLETAKILQISLPTLSEWTKAGIIKGYRINSRVRYKRSEIEESLQEIKSIKYSRK